MEYINWQYGTCIFSKRASFCYSAQKEKKSSRVFLSESNTTLLTKRKPNKECSCDQICSTCQKQWWSHIKQKVYVVLHIKIILDKSPFFACYL